MLDFGFSEILLTSAIALVVLGPERLPKVARQVGNWMGRARLMARQLSEQLEREVNAEELLRQQTKPNSRPEPPALIPPLEASPPPVTTLEPPAPMARAPEVESPPITNPYHDPSTTTAAAMHPPTPPTPPTPTTVDPKQAAQ